MTLYELYLITSSTAKMMVLNGIVYIFVQPNQNSVLAFSLKSEVVRLPMNIHYYPPELNVSKLRNAAPFYQ